MKLFLVWHLGLGDAIIQNGLVRKYRETYDEVVIPCKYKNISTVASMFSDDAKIVVLPVYCDEEMHAKSTSYDILGYKIKRLGIFASDRFDFENWDKAFYIQAKMEPSVRFTHFKVAHKPTIHYTHPYVLMHDDGSRGFHISPNYPRNILIERIKDSTPTLMDWIGVLRMAQEIHMIDSAPLCLALTCGGLQAEKVFIYKSARASIPPSCHNVRNLVVL